MAQTPQAFGTVRHKRDEIGASVANYAAGKTLVQRR